MHYPKTNQFYFGNINYIQIFSQCDFKIWSFLFAADSLVTYAGERFDFVLNANKSVGNYWIRFRGLMDCDERFTSAHQVAILHYDGASEFDEPLGEVSYKAAYRQGLVSKFIQTIGLLRAVRNLEPPKLL